jgi:DNA-binding transcriptional ArsR family regulator
VSALQERDLDRAFGALADATRRAIIARLAAGEATVNELAALSPLTPQAVSRHVAVLRRAGLIHQRIDSQRRPCRLNPVALAALTDWIQVQRQQWDQRLDLLEANLEAIRGDPA